MSQGRLLRSAGLELHGSSAAFALREVPDEPGVALGSLEAGLVLSSPGCAPLSLWTVFYAGDGDVEALWEMAFHLSGVGLSLSLSFALPWAGVVRRAEGGHLDDMPGWAAQGASGLGHPADAAREAAAFLSGMALASVSDALGAALVRRACSLVPPDRVVELAREAAVEQVMEG